MTTEALTVLVAIAVPIVTLAVLVRLIAGIAGLERSRDELNDPGTRQR